MFEISIVLALEIKTFCHFAILRKILKLFQKKFFPFSISLIIISVNKPAEFKNEKLKSLPLLDPKIKPTYRTPISSVIPPKNAQKFLAKSFSVHLVDDDPIMYNLYSIRVEKPVKVATAVHSRTSG